MAAGDVVQVTGRPDLHYVDTGMYETAGYGSVYVVDAERPAIVETGVGTEPELDRILAALETVGIDREEVAVIAVTHVHLDHAGGAGALAAACPNADVVVHERGASHLVDPERIVAGTKAAVRDLWTFYTEPEPVPASRVHAVTDGAVVDLGDHELRVHHAPGHAGHQVVYHDPAVGTVFTGDAAGVWLPERETVRATTPPPEFDLERTLADIELLRSLGPETLAFSHFGPHHDPDEALDAAATALVEWVESVREARAELDDDRAVVERFVAETPTVAAWGEAMARPVASVDVRGVLAYLDREAESREDP